MSFDRTKGKEEREVHMQRGWAKVGMVATALLGISCGNTLFKDHRLEMRIMAGALLAACVIGFILLSIRAFSRSDEQPEKTPEP